MYCLWQPLPCDKYYKACVCICALTFNARRMCTCYSTRFVCVFVSTVYEALTRVVLQFEGVTLIFQDFQLTNFDKKPFFKRYSAFYGYFAAI